MPFLYKPNLHDGLLVALVAAVAAILTLKSNPEIFYLRQNISGFQSQGFVPVEHKPLALKPMLRIAVLLQSR